MIAALAPGAARSLGLTLVLALAVAPPLAGAHEAGARPAASQEAGQQTAAPPASAAAVTKVDSSTPGIINMILVKVNGSAILFSDLLQQEEERMPLIRQQLPEDEIEAQLPELRRRFLIGLIDETMMLQRADSLGIVADANQVDAQIQSLRQANGLETDEQLAEALAAMGMTMNEMRDRMRKTYRQQRLVFEEVNRGLFASESEIRRYYEDHTGDFTAPEQVRLEQLVFLTQGGNTETIRQQAESALADLRSGMSVQEVAARYPGSVPFAEDTGFVPVADLSESLAVAVPAMTVGEFADVVRSQFGFHLVRVLERNSQAVASFEQVRDAIRERLIAEKSQKRLQQYLGQLRQRTNLEILDPLYADIEDAWKAEPETPTTAR